MKHYGDITKLNGISVEPVNVIIGGSPCQDLSIAGKGAGLSGERSGLFMEQLRVIKEMRCKDIEQSRTGIYIRPRFMVWENVPGAFSSNKGKDFQTVLEETIKIVNPEAPPIPIPKHGWPNAGCLAGMEGRWSIAWRVLDAQFWGVPQRRKRIALVADFGGIAAPEILFERESLPGDTEPGRPQGEDTAAETQGSTGTAVGAYCIRDNRPAVILERDVTAYSIFSMASNSMKSENPHSAIYEAQTARTLDISGGNPGCNQGGIVILESHPHDSRISITDDNVVQSLNARMGTGGAMCRC